MYFSCFCALSSLWMSWSLIIIRSCDGAPLTQNEMSSSAQPLHCWETEEFTVLRTCFLCRDYQMKTEAQCIFSGFVEELKCNTSGLIEHRSCRSAAAEELKFWKFEGAMLTFSTLFAVLVMFRQRTLDRRAEYKVQQQIQGI